MRIQAALSDQQEADPSRLAKWHHRVKPDVGQIEKLESLDGQLDRQIARTLGAATDSPGAIE